MKSPLARVADLHNVVAEIEEEKKMKLSDYKNLYRHWVIGYRDGAISSCWKEYARTITMQQRLQVAEDLLRMAAQRNYMADKEGRGAWPVDGNFALEISEFLK